MHFDFLIPVLYNPVDVDFYDGIGRRLRELGQTVAFVACSRAGEKALRRSHEHVFYLYEKGAPPIGPLKDAQRAISLVRSKAKDWGIDPKKIGMVGFSAGGHLVGAACTNFEKRAYEPIDDVDKVSCRPDFGIMCYSGYFKVKDGLSPTVKTPADAPPLMFVHASDDTISDAEHSVTFYLALKRAKVDTEMQIFAKGGHGFGVRPGSPCRGWTRTSVEWLKQRGILTK